MADDDPFNISRDEDLAIRTVIGEAAKEGAKGWRSVAGVIANRAAATGKGFGAVVKEKNQFEPWGSRARELKRIDPNSADYLHVASQVLPVLRGEDPDPTGGATHFYAPKAQRALGRRRPSWDDGSGTDIGNHRFFKLDYGNGGNKDGIRQPASEGDPAAADKARVARDGGPRRILSPSSPLDVGVNAAPATPAAAPNAGLSDAAIRSAVAAFPANPPAPTGGDPLASSAGFLKAVQAAQQLAKAAPSAIRQPSAAPPVADGPVTAPAPSAIVPRGAGGSAPLLPYTSTPPKVGDAPAPTIPRAPSMTMPLPVEVQPNRMAITPMPDAFNPANPWATIPAPTSGGEPDTRYDAVFADLARGQPSGLDNLIRLLGGS